MKRLIPQESLKLDDMNEDRVDEFFNRANALLGTGQFEGAIEVLRTGREEASAEDDRASAAFFSCIAGSFLASRARDEEALAEYDRAEHTDPLSPAWKVATANQLLKLGYTAKARAKAGEVVACGQGVSSYEHVGYSLLGLAEFALGNQAAAMEAFIASVDSAQVSSLPAVGRDLRLVAELLGAGVINELCHAYLRDTLAKAQAEQDEVSERRIQQILSR